MAAGVGEQLLDGAQDRVSAAGVGGLEEIRPGPGQVQFDLLAGLPLPGQDVLDIGPGGAGAVSGTVVMQDSEDLAQLASGVGGEGVDAARDLADAAQIQVGAGLKRAGVEGDQGEAVGEGVVHLAGDAGAFLGAALGDARLLRGADEAGLAGGRAQQLLTGLQVDAQHDADDADRETTDCV